MLIRLHVFCVLLSRRSLYKQLLNEHKIAFIAWPTLVRHYLGYSQWPWCSRAALCSRLLFGSSVMLTWSHTSRGRFLFSSSAFQRTNVGYSLLMIMKVISTTSLWDKMLKSERNAQTCENFEEKFELIFSFLPSFGLYCVHLVDIV